VLWKEVRDRVSVKSERRVGGEEEEGSKGVFLKKVSMKTEKA